MRKWNEITNLACRDYSRKNLEIVARHKETLWKSDITQRRVLVGIQLCTVH